MFSPELMKYIISYQKEECNKQEETKVKEIHFKTGGNKLAWEYLINKK